MFELLLKEWMVSWLSFCSCPSSTQSSGRICAPVCSRHFLVAAVVGWVSDVCILPSGNDHAPVGSCCIRTNTFSGSARVQNILTLWSVGCCCCGACWRQSLVMAGPPGVSVSLWGGWLDCSVPGVPAGWAWFVWAVVSRAELLCPATVSVPVGGVFCKGGCWFASKGSAGGVSAGGSAWGGGCA